MSAVQFPAPDGPTAQPARAVEPTQRESDLHAARESIREILRAEVRREKGSQS